METNDLTQLSEELIQRLGSGGDLEGMMSSDLFQQGDLYISNQEDSNSNVGVDNEIIMHMDIREPLRTLQKLLERKVGLNLQGYEFWLQDAQELEPHKNLVDQCVKGEGLVQINVEIKYIIKRINILDVLKPTEDALAALAAEPYKTDNSTDEENTVGDATENDTEAPKPKKIKRELTLTSPGTAAQSNKPCLNWVLDSKFRKEQLRLKIPENPTEWTISQVKFWFQWAVREFNLANVSISDWAITGRQLCAMSHGDFCKKIPKDPGNIFWTHLQLLKECKFVSVVHKAVEIEAKAPIKRPIQEQIMLNIIPPVEREPKIMRKTFHNLKKEAILHETLNAAAHTLGASSVLTHNTYGIGSGNNGQVQLWQFLLEILTDRDHTDIIQWVGTDGEFKLSDPERVARLWGEKKNKPAMNYEKLSRALRYYYDGDMISKVAGKRFAYKFDCDLKLLIGYTAAELSALVNERSFIDDNVYLERMDTKEDEE